MLTKPWHLVPGVLLVCIAARAEILIGEGTNLAVDVTPAGLHVMDLIGGLWLVPEGGGNAKRLPNDLHPARDPRFAPDGKSIVYVAERGQETELWIYHLDTQRAEPIAAEFGTYEHPDWHPDGDRVVFSAAFGGSDIAIWELDVATGLRWRLTHGGGDSTWPTWSDDGRDLLFVRHVNSRYELVLRRLAQPDEVLLESTEPLSAPSFRPDKSLVTVLRHAAAGIHIEMIILATPRLVRTLVEDEDIFVGRIAWQDRQQMVYAAGGHIRSRHFDSWTSRTVPFSAGIEPPRLAPGSDALGQRLEAIQVPRRGLVVRAARLFDGVSAEYKRDVDIVIEEGRIVSVDPAQDRGDAVVVDLGDITVVPGLMDILAWLPRTADDSIGARLLSFGITAVVTEHPDAADLDRRWSAPETPGPRVLAAASLQRASSGTPRLLILSGDRRTGESFRDATHRWQKAGVPVLAENWQVGLGAGASLVIGGKALPVSPAGRRYEDLRVTNGASAVTLVSALAHAGTRDLEDLFALRQANGLHKNPDSIRRRASPAYLAPGQTQVVLGSAPNRLPPGIAQHAELRAMVEAGLAPVNALKAATVDVATALGLGLTAGRVAPGADANFVLLSGNPLGSINDAANVVAVIRNGRFMSLGRLLDHIDPQQLSE